MVVVVLAVGGVTGLPDEPLGELDEGMVGVFSTLTPLSFIVMTGKLYSREIASEGRATTTQAGGVDLGCCVRGSRRWSEPHQANAGGGGGVEKGSRGFRGKERTRGRGSVPWPRQACYSTDEEQGINDDCGLGAKRTISHSS